jgi:hypothetical protein
MSISTEQAEKMVAEKMAREAEKPAQPEASETPVEQSTPEPKADEPKEEPKEVPQEEPKDQPKEETPEKDEDKSDEKPKPPKRKYTHDERVAHAFSIEKQKRKEQHAKDRARIKELEDELAKYKGLRLEDFQGNVENYTDYRLRERDMQAEVKQTQERIEREEADEMARETERRVNLSFATDDERDDYNELIRTNGPKFYEALQEADPQGVVLDYLNSVEKYPIVLRELMTNMKALGYVFRDKDPVVLRFNLHQFTKDLLNGKNPVPDAESKPEQETTPKPEVKPAIPVIGKQVTTSSTPQEPVHDRNYWNNYLRQHPRG